MFSTLFIISVKFKKCHTFFCKILQSGIVLKFTASNLEMELYTHSTPTYIDLFVFVWRHYRYLWAWSDRLQDVGTFSDTLMPLGSCCQLAAGSSLVLKHKDRQKLLKWNKTFSSWTCGLCIPDSMAAIVSISLTQSNSQDANRALAIWGSRGISDMMMPISDKFPSSSKAAR